MLWFDQNGKVIIESCRENINRLHRGTTIYGACGVLHDWRRSSNGAVEIHATPKLPLHLIANEMPDLVIEVLPVEESPIPQKYIRRGEDIGKDPQVWVFRCELPPFRHISSYALLLMRLICEHIRKTGRVPRSLKSTFKHSGQEQICKLSMRAWELRSKYNLVDVDRQSIKGIIDWVRYELANRVQRNCTAFIRAAGVYENDYREETME